MRPSKKQTSQHVQNHYDDSASKSRITTALYLAEQHASINGCLLSSKTITTHSLLYLAFSTFLLICCLYMLCVNYLMRTYIHIRYVVNFQHNTAITWKPWTVSIFAWAIRFLCFSFFSRRVYKLSDALTWSICTYFFLAYVLFCCQACTFPITGGNGVLQ